MTECTEDIRVGGAFRWAWSGPDGQLAMAMHGVYREVVPPSAGGGRGRLIRSETFDMGYPAQAGEQVGTMLSTERDERATLTVTVVYPSKEDRDGALASGMEHGMAVGYDQLEALLKSQAAV